MTALFAIARLILLESARARFFWLVGGVLLCGFLLAEFAGELAFAETKAIQGVLLAAFLRTAAVIALSLFVLTSQVREFQDKGVELVLSLPINRGTYYAGRLLGFLLVALVLAGLCSLLLLPYVPWDMTVLWGGALWCELAILVAFSLFALFTFQQVTSAFSVVLAFYVLARSIASIQLVTHGPIMPTNTITAMAMSRMIDAIAFLLPRLDQFTQSEWLLYGQAGGENGSMIVIQTVLYVILLSAAALFDLYRKSF